MFNLLPKREKEMIRKEYKTRLFAVILCFSFATFLIGGVSLIPSYTLSSQKEKSAEARFETLSRNVQKGEEAHLERELLDAKEKVSLLRRESPRLYFYEFLIKISTLKSEGVILGGVSVLATKEKKKEVRISGEATNRNTLVAFSRALEGTGLFEGVEIPVSSFAKEADIPFSIATMVNF